MREVEAHDHQACGTHAAMPTRVPGGLPQQARSKPARAVVLQRLVGNRGASRLLARWTKHPDEEQKGVMVPDAVAADFLRCNPPQNK